MLLAFRRRFSRTAIFSRLADVSCRASLKLCPRHQPVALVVDDDPDVAPLVSAALSPYTFVTEDVRDGGAALQRLRERCYDLVILDLGMDGLNGYDVLLTLRNDPRCRTTPVIVLTANSSDESVARSFGYGADDFIAKPFKINELGMRAYRLVNPLTVPKA